MQEEGNIYTVLKNSSKKYVDSFEIIKGELIFSSQSKQELDWAQEIGIKVSPYLIIDGELMSADQNLYLMDEETGTITIPENVTKIGEGAFAKVGVRKLVIPPTVKEISKNAFNGNSTLEEVIFQTRTVQGKEEGLERIGDCAFYNCKLLKTIEMPNTVTAIGREVFYSCSSLNNIVLSNNLTDIPYHTFGFCSSLREIIIPEKVKTIGRFAMRNCSSLKSITIPKGVETLSATVFTLTRNITTVNIPEDANFKFKDGILFNKDETKIIYLSSSILQGDTFNVPNKIQSLESGLISGYGNIKNVKIPASVTSIDTGFYTDTITKVEIDENNPNYCSTGEVIYNKEKTIIYRHLNTKISVNVEEGVVEIADNAFQANSNITSITLPDSLVSIKWEAFMNLNNLKSINIGKKVQYLNPMAFYKTKNITNFIIDKDNDFFETDGVTIYNKGRTKIVTVLPEVQNYTIPNGITEIGEDAFFQQNIKEITIPEGVTTIRRKCF